MRTVAIVQARLGSTRFPGKVLKPIAKRPSIVHTLIRTEQAVPLTVLAVPWNDHALVELAKDIWLPLYQGSADDVLARYLGAAEQYEADVVVRITGDCPLVDPGLVKQVVQHIEDGAEFASNVWPWRTYPQGLDVQAFTMDLLRRTAREATAQYDREHVCPYMQKIAKKIGCVRQPKDHSHHRWTLDTPADYRFFQSLAERLGFTPPKPTTAEVLALLDREPELCAINAEVAHIYPPTS